MARRVTKETSNDQTSGDQTVTEDQTEDQTAAASEGGATEDNSAWFAEFSVTVSPAEGNDNGEHFTATVTRTAKGVYSAKDGTTVGAEGSSAKVAVNNLIRAKKAGKPSNYVVTGLDNEPATPAARADNAAKADPWTDNDAERAALDAIGVKLVEAEDAISHAEIGVKEGWLSLGGAVSEAFERFKSYTETGNVDNKQWARWITAQQAPGGLFHGHPRLTASNAKNTMSEARAMAEAPSDVLALLPREYNSPKSFQKWVNDNKNGFCAIVAEKLHAKLEAEADPDSSEPVKATSEGLAQKAADYAQSLRDGIAKARAEAEAKAAKLAKDPDAEVPAVESLLPSKIREDIARVAIYEWLAGELPVIGTEGYAEKFGETRLGKALWKQWEAVSAAPSDDEGETEGAEKESAPVKGGFADLSIFDAASHIFALLRSRRDAEDMDAILDHVANMIEESNAEDGATEETEADAAAAAS